MFAQLAILYIYIYYAELFYTFLSMLGTLITTMLLIWFDVILQSFRYTCILLYWDYRAVDSELYYTEQL